MTFAMRAFWPCWGIKSPIRVSVIEMGQTPFSNLHTLAQFRELFHACNFQMNFQVHLSWQILEGTKRTNPFATINAFKPLSTILALYFLSGELIASYCPANDDLEFVQSGFSLKLTVNRFSRNLLFLLFLGENEIEFLWGTKLIISPFLTTKPLRSRWHTQKLLQTTILEIILLTRMTPTRAYVFVQAALETLIALHWSVNWSFHLYPFGQITQLHHANQLPII